MPDNRELFRIVFGFLFMKMMYDKGSINSALLMDEDVKYICDTLRDILKG